MLSMNKMQVMAMALGIAVALVCCLSLSSAAPVGTESIDADQLEQEVFGKQAAEEQAEKDKNKPVPIQPAKPGSVPVDDVRLMELRAQCREAAETRIIKEAERMTGRKDRVKSRGPITRNEVTIAPLVLTPAQQALRKEMREECARAAEKRADRSAKRGTHQ